MSRYDPAGRHATAQAPDHTRVGYVLKMYPRFSEAFIVSEILGREARGTDIRPPSDARFHETLGAVRAPVTYLAYRHVRAEDVWELARRAHARLPVLAELLDELLATEVDAVAQALELALLVEERGITHLHAHFGSVATTVARLAALLTGVPYSFTAHAKDIFHDSVDPCDLHKKLRDAQHAVTVSDYNLAYLRGTYGSAAARLRRVYNGLDLDHFAYSPPEYRPPTIAAVGRLVEKKGFEDLITACGILAGRGRRFQCVLAGTGPNEGALHDRVMELGLAGHVTMPGAIPQAEVRTLIRRSAVFAAPCVVGSDGNQDGLPTVLLEAMALGTPCVSTDVAGIPEVVGHGVTGLAVAQRDPVALAEAIAALLDDAAMRVRLAGAARPMIEGEFDTREQARKLADLAADAAGVAGARGTDGGHVMHPNRKDHPCVSPMRVPTPESRSSG